MAKKKTAKPDEKKTPHVYLVEQHIIRADDPRFASKNLFNRVIRQEYITNQTYMGYEALDKLLKENKEECYLALPAKVSQQVVMGVDHDWQSFFAANKEFKRSPEKFRGRPRLPKYKHKEKGRNVLTYTEQAVSRRALKKGVIVPSQLSIEVQTNQKWVHQVRIVPRKDHYVVEVVYSVKPQESKANPERLAALDMELNNLAALTSNKPGFVPLLVNGRPLKSINQFYNQRRAHLQSLLPKGKYNSHQIDDLTQTRNRRIKHYLHDASRLIIDHLVKEDISTLIIGLNKEWKQEINLGKQTNQNFVFIPHSQFIKMLQYKAALIGIKVIVREESYTSKCSSLTTSQCASTTPIRASAFIEGYLGLIKVT